MNNQAHAFAHNAFFKGLPVSSVLESAQSWLLNVCHHLAPLRTGYSRRHRGRVHSFEVHDLVGAGNSFVESVGTHYSYCDAPLSILGPHHTDDLRSFHVALPCVVVDSLRGHPDLTY